MLEAKHVDFRYPKSRQMLIEDFSMTLAPGEIVGLPGVSGTGKSTAAKILSGFLTPESGNVFLDDQPFPRKGISPVQLLFQHPELAVNPRWKIRSILSEAGMPDPDLMERLSINATWLERYPHELSGGELQRICLARALNENVRYLICDEMTSMLDALTQALIWKAVLDIAEQKHLGMMVISHDGELIDRLCHRTVDYFQN